MVVRMRSTSSHRDHRRSHFALSPARLSVCPKCGEKKLPHVACARCGTYKGRIAFDVLKKIEKKAKRAKEKGTEERKEEKAAENV